MSNKKELISSYNARVCPGRTKEKCPQKRKYNFYGNSLNVCIDGEGKKKEIDEIAIFSSYMQDSDMGAAYYVGKDYILLMQGSSEGGECWHILAERYPLPENGEDGITQLKEEFFAGSFAQKIVESSSEIISTATPKETGKIVLLVLLLIGGVLFFLYQGGQLDEAIGKVKPVEQAPMPTYPPLTAADKQVLKHSLSATFFREIGKRVKTGLAHTKTLRIVRAGFSGYSDIPQSAPQYNEAENRWYFPSPDEENMRRGGVGLNGEIELNRNYLNVGTKVTNPSLHIFGKTINPSKRFGAKELLTAKKSIKPLTKVCIESVLYGLSKKVVPQKGDDQSITVEVNEISPSAMMEKTGWLLENCPFYINELSVSSSKFKMSAVLFPDKPLKKDDHVQD